MKCPSLTITFLGTGTSSGVPMVGCDCDVCVSGDFRDKRLRSSIMVQSATTTIVVDTTPDFRYQMLRTHTKHLDALLFTHPHKDHMGGLDDIRPFNFFSKQPMKVYANALTEEALRRDFYYAFADTKYPGVPDLDMQSIDETPFYIGDIPIIPIQVWHLKMPVYGFRFGDFTYITDANKIEQDQLEKIKGSSVLILNALRREQHISHFTLTEAVQLVTELNIPEAYFTHISHQLGKHEQVCNELPKHIKLAYDGMVIQL